MIVLKSLAYIHKPFKKRLKTYLANWLILKASKSKKLASIFYGFFWNDFDREHQGVVYGKLKYLENSQDNREENYLIRRNVHRLEKGILMKPRRDTFALDYIEETVDAYCKLASTTTEKYIDTEELCWAYDVLSEYFSLVGKNSLLDRLREKFNAASPSPSPSPGPTPSGCEVQRVPYKRDLSSPAPVKYEDLLSLSIRRRSVRWYLQKPVSHELIDKAIKIAGMSPSACNRQPYEFLVFDEPDWVQKISSLPMGTRGFSHNFPAIVVLVGKLRAYFSERDRHVIYIDASLAAMSFMYALETLGLSSCPINWPDVEHLEQQIASLLGLEPDERVIMLISMGYPDPEGMVAYSQKKSVSNLRRYNNL